MKRLGLIGGLSWESSSLYYTLLNQAIQRSDGGSHSALCTLYSLDFAPIEVLQTQGKWDELRKIMHDAGRALKASGADAVMICSNTMHKLADGFEQETGLPLLNIIDAVGQAVRTAGLKRIALLGTRFTMEDDFYRSRLEKDFGLEVLLPSAADRQTIHSIIYGELVRGRILESSQASAAALIERLVDAGAEGIILGCTELGLLIRTAPRQLFDSTLLHVQMGHGYLSGRLNKPHRGFSYEASKTVETAVASPDAVAPVPTKTLSETATTKEAAPYTLEWALELERAGQLPNLLFFWGHTSTRDEPDRSCLSQWYPSPFMLDDHQYLCAEQYMMAEKARIFGDRVIRAQILAGSDPANIKHLGRQIHNFDEERWSQERFEVVVRGNRAKFRQNRELGAFLRSTGNALIVEASPVDTLWGIGCTERESSAQKPSTWRGQNLLGFALMKVRDTL